jgi:general secretion pathway protein G
MGALRRHLRHPRGGFTLIELMVVMVILVLLAGGASLYVIRRIEDGRRARAISDIQTLESALQQYYVDNGRYPTTEEGLMALLEPPSSASNWRGPYVKLKNGLQDPWGNEYQYRQPGEHNPDFDLWSYGRDGVEGGEGPDADITNWSETGI